MRLAKRAKRLNDRLCYRHIGTFRSPLCSVPTQRRLKKGLLHCRLRNRTETAANCTSSSCRNAGAGPKALVRACRRQTVSRLGCTSCRRATSMTLAPGSRLSSTTRRFSAVVHRRRRSGPDRTAALLTFAHLLANQSANYCGQGCRPEGGLHRRITQQAATRDTMCWRAMA